MNSFHELSRYLQNTDRNVIPFYNCIVKKDHRTLFHQMEGICNPKTGETISDDTLCWIYSMTKVITSTAAMQLAEQGKLDFNAPVSLYLPEFEHLSVLQDEKIVPCTKTLTVRHLITMQGGLDYDLENPFIAEADRKYNGNATTRQIAAALAKKPLSFLPGADYQYSLCHDVLAAVIEAASGKTFGQYLRENILAPLHMEDTGFTPTGEQQSRFAAQYCFDPEAGISHVTEFRNKYRLSGLHESGGAGLFSKAGDYIKFADALCCGGTSSEGVQILTPETLVLYRTPQLQGKALETFSGAMAGGYSYGLGVRTMVDPSRGSRSPVGEFGWNGAAGSYVMIDPVNHLTIVYFQSVLNYQPAAAMQSQIRDLTYRCLSL